MQKLEVKTILVFTILICVLFTIPSHSVFSEEYSQDNFVVILDNKQATNTPIQAEEDSDYIMVDKQVQIVAEVSNSQDKVQPFAYIVQIRDENEVTISLAWLTGSLSPKQMLSPALSWTPEKAGTYTATIFVWESIKNPEALSPPLVLQIKVR